MLEKIVFVQGCSTSAPCESQLCHSFQTRQKEEKGWKGSWERCRFCVCPHKKVGPKKVLKWLNWWHWHSNQGFCQTYLCLQERPLGVWSHEQNAPSGPRLFHPGKKGLQSEFENPPIFDFQAMDFLAEQLRDPIFVIVTDDPSWAKSQIPPGFRPFFTGENTLDWSVFW